LGDIGSGISSGDLGALPGDYTSALAMANPLSAASAAVTGGQSVGQAVQSVQQTNVGQQFAQASQLGSVDLGSGFFPGGTVTNVWQPRAARDVRGTINGSAWTFGRQAASIVTQPGTKQYNLMSGLIDGATQWVADPTIALSEQAMTTAKAARAFELAGKAAEEVPQAGEQTGKAIRSGVGAAEDRVQNTGNDLNDLIRNVRDQALQVAQQRAGGRLNASLAGNGNANLRAWLLGKANQITAKYRQFSRPFDAVLSGEVHQ
jgi:hypothetical protein